MQVRSRVVAIKDTGALGMAKVGRWGTLPLRVLRCGLAWPRILELDKWQCSLACKGTYT